MEYKSHLQILLAPNSPLFAYIEQFGWKTEHRQGLKGGNFLQDRYSGKIRIFDHLQMCFLTRVLHSHSPSHSAINLPILGERIEVYTLFQIRGVLSVCSMYTILRRIFHIMRKVKLHWCVCILDVE